MLSQPQIVQDSWIGCPCIHLPSSFPPVVNHGTVSHDALHSIYLVQIFSTYRISLFGHLARMDSKSFHLREFGVGFGTAQVEGLSLGRSENV